MITAESFHNIAAGFESLATILSLAVGGWWVYRIYVSQQDAFAHVESSAAINFLGEQDDQRLIELTTTLQNK